MAKEKSNPLTALKRGEKQLVRHNNQSPAIKVSRVTDKGRIVYHVDISKPNEKRKRRTIHDAQEALDFAKQVSYERLTDSAKISELSPDEQAEAVKLFKMIRDGSVRNVSASDMVADYIRRNAVAVEGESIEELVGVYLADLERRVESDNLRRSLLTTNRSHVRKLVRLFGDRSIISLDELEDLIPALDNWKNVTRGNIRTGWVAFFKWAKDNNLIDVVPLTGLSTKGLRDIGRPSIFPVDHVTQIMHYIEVNRPELIPKYALSFFAGVRVAEIKRLSWSDIHFDSGIIEIPASKSKTRKRDRDIQITPNLMRWLAPFRNRTGKIHTYSKTNEDRFRKKMFEKLDFAPVHNGGRHSFGSYSIKAHGDLNRAIDEMGHKNSAIFKDHYDHGRVTPEQGDAYFNINPAPSSAIIEYPHARAS